jgi:hypothetical protein
VRRRANADAHSEANRNPAAYSESETSPDAPASAVGAKKFAEQLLCEPANELCELPKGVIFSPDSERTRLKQTHELALVIAKAKGARRSTNKVP